MGSFLNLAFAVKTFDAKRTKGQFTERAKSHWQLKAFKLIKKSFEDSALLYMIGENETEPHVKTAIAVLKQFGTLHD